MAQNENAMRDMVSRSLGTCRYAYRMDFLEFMKHCSNLKLGVSLGLVTGLEQQRLDALIAGGQSASLCAAEGRLLSEQEENAVRAAYVRKALEE